MNQKKPDWIIHFVANTSECCDINETTFHDCMCDAHTHGLARYGSKELQIVLALPPDLIGYTLNTVGGLVRDGLELKDGDVLEGLFENGLKVKVFETKDSMGDDILRLILPDSSSKFPEESTEYPYNKQYGSPYLTRPERKN